MNEGNTTEARTHRPGDFLDVEISEMTDHPVWQLINHTFIVEHMFEIMLILTGAKSTCKRRVSC